MPDSVSDVVQPDGTGSGAPGETHDKRNAGDWLAAMDAIAEEDGYLDPLGPKHYAFFAETGPVLLVGFERAEHIRARPDTLPEGFEAARKNGWSYLCLIAEGETFWRAPEVWGYFDRLVDDAFFDDFDQVLFYGAGPAGYAAASYVVTAPGASALLVSPRATLDPALAGWDRRHLAQRGLDFNSRYGFAPDMTEGAGRVWLIHDPLITEDNAHAALFRRPWVTSLPARWSGARPDEALQTCGALDEVIQRAMTGSLTPLTFAQLWRARRSSGAWLGSLAAAAEAGGHSRFVDIATKAGAVRVKAPRFSRGPESLPPESGSPGSNPEAASGGSQ